MFVVPCIVILGWRNPKRCNGMQIVTAKLLYMFRASIAPIIRSTQNCNCSLWYRSYYLGSKLLQTWPSKSSTCFGRPSRPSSAVHKTVVAASGTDRTKWGASFFKRDHLWFKLTIHYRLSFRAVEMTANCRMKLYKARWVWNTPYLKTWRKLCFMMSSQSFLS